MRLDLPFSTERLTLREFTVQDAENLYALDHDPGVLRYFNRPPHGTVDEYRKIIAEQNLPAYKRHPGLGFFATENKAGEFVGWFCLRPASEYAFGEAAGFEPDDLELGYRLRTAYWGQGLATEGARALAEATLRRLPRVVAATRIDNKPSKRVLEKCGFRRIGEPWNIDPTSPDGISFVRER